MTLKGFDGDGRDEPFFYEDVQFRRERIRERRAILLAVVLLLLAIAMTRM